MYTGVMLEMRWIKFVNNSIDIGEYLFLVWKESPQMIVTVDWNEESRECEE